jgi:hypothetical protein
MIYKTLNREKQSQDLTAEVAREEQRTQRGKPQPKQNL